MNRAVLFFVINKESSYCPICGELLLFRSWRSRGIIDSDGKKIKFFIRRMSCAPCNRIHHELPDCMVPYKRHCAETIEKITSGRHENAPCEGRTINRILAWWCIVLPYFLNILKSLTEKHKIEFNAPPVFRETIRAVANSNGWVFANSICTRSVQTSG